jgi:hypothetical protein
VHEQITPMFSSETLPAYDPLTLLGSAEIGRDHWRHAASDLRSTLEINWFVSTSALFASGLLRRDTDLLR